MLQRPKDMNWLDQLAHAVAGIAIASVVGVFTSWWVGLAAAMGFAVVREFIQHPWQCRAGCLIDLAFWFLGAGLAAGGLLLF
jgi:hypothetical protein